MKLILLVVGNNQELDLVTDVAAEASQLLFLLSLSFVVVAVVAACL